MRSGKPTEPSIARQQQQQQIKAFCIAPCGPKMQRQCRHDMLSLLYRKHVAMYTSIIRPNCLIYSFLWVIMATQPCSICFTHVLPPVEVEFSVFFRSVGAKYCANQCESWRAFGPNFNPDRCRGEGMEFKNRKFAKFCKIIALAYHLCDS